MGYRRMILAERVGLFELLYMRRLNPSQIAKLLNRRPSTITREIANGADSYGVYNPLKAETRHLGVRRKQRPRIKMTKEAWELIKSKLDLNLSPEQIAEWLKHEHPEHSMCAKTIYNYMSSRKYSYQK